MYVLLLFVINTLNTQWPIDGHFMVISVHSDIIFTIFKNKLVITNIFASVH